MAKTVIVEYEDIYQSDTIATLVGPHPIITVTNPGIASTTLSDIVIATVVSVEPLLAIITLSTTTITSTIGTTTLQLGTLITIPEIQIPPQITTFITFSTSSSG